MDTEDTKKIGFFVYYPFQYYVHKNIYKALETKGYSVSFVIDPTGNFPTRPGDQTLEKMKELLLSEGVSFVEFPFDHYFSESHRDQFLKNYSLIVSTWHRGLVRIANDQKKVCLQYGAGKEMTTLGFWKRHFDLCLAYGEYSHKFYTQLTGSVMVGNPKFDDWYAANFDNNLISRINAKINTNKKTILYLPTHSDLSSIDQLADTLKKYSTTYNIIIKLHYYNVLEDALSVEKLDDPNLIILDDSEDLLTLLHIADVVLSDNSSAIFDALLANKPTVVTDFLDEEYLNKGHRDLRSYRRGFGSALTYSNSIEQRIKKDGTVVTIKNIDEFDYAIQKTLQDGPEFKNKRKELTDLLFKFQDKFCGERAANAIINLLNVEKLPERPFLSHAIDFFETDTIRSNFFTNSETFNEADSKDLLAPEDVCFIICDNENNPDDVYKTVLSLSSSLVSNIFVLTEREAESRERIDQLQLDNKNILYRKRNDLAKIIQRDIKKLKKCIFIQAGCIFKTPGYLKRVENILLAPTDGLTCGYVTRNRALSSSWDKLLDLEVRVTTGFYYYNRKLKPKHFFAIKNALWENPVNEPRFFSVSTSVLCKETFLLPNQNSEYQILLLLKNYFVRRSIPNSFIPITVEDTSIGEKNYYLYKIKVRVAITNYVKRKIKLLFRLYIIWLIILHPGSYIKLLPSAIAAFFVELWYVLVFFTALSLKKQLKNSNANPSK